MIDWDKEIEKEIAQQLKTMEVERDEHSDTFYRYYDELIKLQKKTEEKFEARYKKAVNLNESDDLEDSIKSNAMLDELSSLRHAYWDPRFWRITRRFMKRLAGSIKDFGT